MLLPASVPASASPVKPFIYMTEIGVGWAIYEHDQTRESVFGCRKVEVDPQGVAPERRSKADATGLAPKKSARTL